MTAKTIALAVAAFTCPLLLLAPSHAYTAPLNKGLEVRVCQDKDCLLDGSKETLALVQSMTPTNDAADNNPITVAACGCLGPCGSGPTVDVRQDGIRVKDTREGQGEYFLFRNINSAKAVAEMLTIAGVDVNVEPSSMTSSSSASTDSISVKSTRQWYELDRNSRISLQRILYAITALPLLNAHLNGTWDVIGGVVVPNSYYAIGAAIFVASQFMGTSQRSNAVVEEE